MKKEKTILSFLGEELLELEKIRLTKNFQSQLLKIETALINTNKILLEEEKNRKHGEEKLILLSEKSSFFNTIKRFLNAD